MHSSSFCTTPLELLLLLLTLFSRQAIATKSHLRPCQKQDASALVRTNTTTTTTSPSSPPSFDFYVLSMSYQPEFCYQHRHESFPGCESPMEFWKHSLTLHGLWPQYIDGSWPSTCTHEPFHPETIIKIGIQDMELHWPNVKASPPSSFDIPSSPYTSFWEHEWSKHGTCSGLNQTMYFQTALGHFLTTPDLVGENYGGIVSKRDLEEAYGTVVKRPLDAMMLQDMGGGEGGEAVLVCSGKFLSEVRICIGRSMDGMGTVRIPCTTDVVQEGTCGDLIHIPKFYSEYDFETIMGHENGQGVSAVE